MVHTKKRLTTKLVRVQVETWCGGAMTAAHKACTFYDTMFKMLLCFGPLDVMNG